MPYTDTDEYTNVLGTGLKYKPHQRSPPEYAQLTWPELVEQVKIDNPNLDFKEVLKHASLIYRGKHQLYEKPLFLKGKKAKSSAVSQARKFENIKHAKRVKEVKDYNKDELLDIIQNELLGRSHRRLEHKPESKSRKSIETQTDTPDDYYNDSSEPEPVYKRRQGATVEEVFDEPPRRLIEHRPDPSYQPKKKYVEPESESDSESSEEYISDSEDEEQKHSSSGPIKPGRFTFQDQLAYKLEQRNRAEAKRLGIPYTQFIIERKRGKGMNNEMIGDWVKSKYMPKKGGGVPSQLKPWQDHVKKVRAKNPNLAYKDVLKKAKLSWK